MFSLYHDDKDLQVIDCTRSLLICRSFFCEGAQPVRLLFYLQERQDIRRPPIKSIKKGGPGHSFNLGGNYCP